MNQRIADLETEASNLGLTKIADRLNRAQDPTWRVYFLMGAEIEASGEDQDLYEKISSTLDAVLARTAQLYPLEAL